jgi:hypothetical protein
VVACPYCARVRGTFASTDKAKHARDSHRDLSGQFPPARGRPPGPSLPQRKQPGPDDMPGSDATRSAVVQRCKNLRRSQDIHSGSRESAPIAADSRPRLLHISGRAVSRLVASGLAGVPIPGVPGRVGNRPRSTDQDQPASCRCGADGHGGTSRVCPTTARTARGRLDLGNLALCVDGVNQTGDERWRRDGALPHPPLGHIDDVAVRPDSCHGESPQVI